MEVILIRHTAVDVPHGVCYGQTDVPLKSSFHAEADNVNMRLKELAPFDYVYCSPLSRCVKLAEWCGYKNAERDNRLLEINMGEWEMQRYDDIADPRLKEWYADYLNVPVTGGESFAMQYMRVSSFLDELKGKSYQKVAIFTHGGVTVCAQIYAKTADFNKPFDAVPPYGGIVRITL